MNNEMEIHRTNATAKNKRLVHWWRPVIDYRGRRNENLRNLQILGTRSKGANSPGEGKTPMAALQFKRGNQNGGG